MFEAMLLAASVESGFPAVDLVSDSTGHVLFPAPQLPPRDGLDLVVLQVAVPSDEPDRWTLTSALCVTSAGPASWGVIDGAGWIVSYNSLSSSVAIVAYPFADRMSHAQRMRREGQPDRAAMARATTHDLEHGRRLKPLEAIVADAELLRGVRRDELELSFDLVYTAANHVMFVVVRDGELRWWTFNKPEEEDWVERGAMPTRIQGHFRIVKAGDDLYLIDERGWVFASPQQGGQLLGNIAGWRTPTEGETLFLLEEHNENKFAAVLVTNEGTSILEFRGGTEVHEDYLEEIPTPALRAALIRADSIRRAAQ